jgi:hypothetical protein
MAFLITQPLKTIYNTNHPNAYAKVSTYMVDVLNERIRVNVSIFANQEARLIAAQPINIKTFTFSGKEYKEIQSVPLEEMNYVPESPGDPLQGVIISLYSLQLQKVYEILSTKSEFVGAERVTEEMITNNGERKAGEEISLQFAEDNKLREGIHFTQVISTL